MAVMESKPAAAPLATGLNIPEYSVSELSLRLKRTIEEAFQLVRVRGEISGFKRAASGHLYLALKDAEAVLDAVCWKGTAARLGVKPEDGLEVVCTGRLTTYPGRSKYQLVIERMELAGVGALMALLEQRKQKLRAEGLFEPERKKPLPYLPEVIGVVTSPTGAVIRDILHRLRDRFPRRVLIWPVLVQGEGAAEQVAAAIRGFNALRPGGPVPRPDLLIVARGGGSLEDLWAFNEEIVVRAAADSAIPLVSAVGHETDTTLIDFAASQRAPTPTAAAEMAVPVRLEIAADVGDLAQRLTAGLERRFAEQRERIRGLARGLRDPRELLGRAGQRLDEFAERLKPALTAGFERRRHQLVAAAAALRPQVLNREIRALKDRLGEAGGRLKRELGRRISDLRSGLAAEAKLLESLSYHAVLERGFAVVRTDGAGPVTSATAATPGLGVEIEFRDGRRRATIAGIAVSVRPKRPRGGDDQGSLL